MSLDDAFAYAVREREPTEVILHIGWKMYYHHKSVATNPRSTLNTMSHALMTMIPLQGSSAKKAWAQERADARWIDRIRMPHVAPEWFVEMHRDELKARAEEIIEHHTETTPGTPGETKGNQ